MSDSVGYTSFPITMHIASHYLLLCVVCVVGCGDNSILPPDAQIARNNVLEVQTPPGDSIGLDYSGATTLRVRLVDSQGLSIPGELVSFSLLQTGGESAGGSSLSSSTSRTNTIGIAEIDLVAGAERVNFRVEASTPNAPSVLFYVQVSDQGFSDVSIESVHQGPRDPTGYDQIELRIYDDRDVHCSEVSFTPPPESMFPMRTQLEFGERSAFLNLAVGNGYTIIAWAEAGTDATPQATGCLHLASDRLRSGSALEAVLPLTDLPYKLGTLLLETSIDLQPLAATLTGAAAWSTLACPLGRAQLLLDCLPDVQNTDTAIDCDAQTPGPLRAAIESQRGVIAGDGCRPAALLGGEASLDARLSAAIAGWPSASERASLTDGRAFVLGSIRIRSELSSMGTSLARHRLLEAQVGSAIVDLIASNRPLLIVSGLPLGLDAAPVLRVPEHEFTLRYGQIADAAYEVLALAPANVSMQGLALGTGLIDGILIAGQPGCGALEDFVCTDLGLEPSCANQCSTLSGPLDTLLGAWLGEIQSTGLDYRFAMQAQTTDSNMDLIMDSASAHGDAVQIQLTTQPSSFALPGVVTTLE